MMSAGEGTFLEPKQQKGMRLFWSVVIAAIVNGIMWNTVKDFQWDKDAAMLLFFSVFLLAGLWTVGYMAYNLLMYFAPQVRLMISPESVRKGQETVLAWKIAGGGHRVENLTVLLIGEEEVEYKRGTNTVKESSPFYVETLVEETDLRFVSQGTANILIPADREDLLPTWSTKHNRIKWRLEVHMIIRQFPDAEERYEINVLPVEKGE